MDNIRKYVLEDLNGHVKGFKSFKGNEDKLNEAIEFLSSRHKGNFKLFVYNENDIELKVLNVSWV